MHDHDRAKSGIAFDGLLKRGFGELVQTQSSERCSKAMAVVTDGKGAWGIFWNDVDLSYLLWMSVTQVPTFVKNSLKLKNLSISPDVNFTSI